MKNCGLYGVNSRGIIWSKKLWIIWGETISMKLSKRLSAVAAMVTPGMVLADIGTDHAYIPIDLVERGVIPRAIAADVNPGPLFRAEEHIREHGLDDRIATRLCDGLTAFEAGEVQSIVIAGMGGALTVRILQDGGHLFGGHTCVGPIDECMRTGKCEAGEDSRSLGEHGAVDGCLRGGTHAVEEDSWQSLRQDPELVLQPQSEIVRVRLWLWQNGWEIVQEDMVFEDGKYYPMMKARHVKTGQAAVSASLWPQSFPDDDGMEKIEAPILADKGERTWTSTLNTRKDECLGMLISDIDGRVCRDLAAKGADIERKLCLEFGPKLLEARHPVLREYLLKEKAIQERILAALSSQKSQTAVSRTGEIQEKLSLTEEALKLFTHFS